MITSKGSIRFTLLSLRQSERLPFGSLLAYSEEEERQALKQNGKYNALFAKFALPRRDDGLFPHTIFLILRVKQTKFQSEIESPYECNCAKWRR